MNWLCHETRFDHAIRVINFFSLLDLFAELLEWLAGAGEVLAHPGLSGISLRRCRGRPSPWSSFFSPCLSVYLFCSATFPFMMIILIYFLFHCGLN
jgi:hypothetical protein